MAYEYINSKNYNGLSGMWGHYGDERGGFLRNILRNVRIKPAIPKRVPLPPKRVPLPPPVKPKKQLPVIPKIKPKAPVSDDMAKLKEDVIRRTTQETQPKQQIPYVMDPLTGQYIPAVPGMFSVLPPVTTPKPSPTELPGKTPTGIMLPTMMRGPVRSIPRTLPAGPKAVITPQQARLGTLTAALAAGLLFL